MDERLRRGAWGLRKDLGRRLPGADRSEPRALFVLGCQRSGTTMLVETLDKDPRIKTYPEFSSMNVPAPGRRPWSVRPASRHTIRLRPLEEVAARIRRSAYPLVVLKPLVESQHAHRLLAAVDRSICVWAFRHYRDVARSNVVRFTPQVTRTNLEPMVRPQPGNWRSEVVPEDARELIQRHYRPGISPFDGGALFWYARNKLFFAQRLEEERRVVPVKYEDLVAQPEQVMRALYAQAGLEFPGAALVDDIHPRSLGLGQELELDPEIEAACEELWRELNAAYDARSPSSSR